jgi:hypothetical protein
LSVGDLLTVARRAADMKPAACLHLVSNLRLYTTS